MAIEKKSNTAITMPISMWNKWLTMVLRFVVGAIFVFSGFVKAIDPWGTIFKVNDYLAAMHITMPDGIVLIGVFSLFLVEFSLGIFLIFGCYRRLAPLASLLMMLVMLPITLWIAIDNPVSDCGCFGDALLLSHWQTFWKNIVLTVMVIWLVLYARKSRCFIIPTLQWLAVAVTVIFIVIVSIYGYIYQPLLDFRPYPIGDTLISQDDEDASEFVFVYEKDGQQSVFAADSIPESEDWIFVERQEIKSDSKENKPSKLLRIYNRSDEDVTEMVVQEEGRQIILFYSSLDEVSVASTYQINSLYSYCQRNKIDMISVVAASEEEIVEWEDLSMPSYEIYIAEDTSIKEVVRGNPSIVYLEDGKIMFKSSLRAIDVEDFLSEKTSSDPMSFARDNFSILFKVILIYFLSLVGIVALSHVPMAVRYVRRRIGKNSLIVDDDEMIENHDVSNVVERQDIDEGSKE